MSPITETIDGAMCACGHRVADHADGDDVSRIGGLFRFNCEKCECRRACLARPAAVLVGESNPYRHARQAGALLPLPRGASGDRLRVALGLSDKQYMAAFARTNLFGRAEKPSARLAVARVFDVKRWMSAMCFNDVPLVLLGRRVHRAFWGGPPPPLFTVMQRSVVFLPHPSGRCRAWNEPGAAAEARAAVASVLR